MHLIDKSKGFGLKTEEVKILTFKTKKPKNLNAGPAKNKNYENKSLTLRHQSVH